MPRSVCYVAGLVAVIAALLTIPPTLSRAQFGCVDLYRVAPRIPMPSGVSTAGLAVADFNHDGRLDFAVSRSASEYHRDPGGVEVLLGSGGGETPISGRMSYDIGNTNSILAGEFTGDEHVDVVTSDYDGNSVSVLAGDGMGGLEPRSRLTVGKRYLLKAAGNFNTDAHKDVVLGRSTDAGGRVEGELRLLLGNGSGGFDTADVARVEQPPSDAAVADFDNDGFNDLVVGSEVNDAGVFLLLGDGRGGLQDEPDALPWRTRRAVNAVGVADFDADGNQDVAAAWGRGIAVRLGDGTGAFHRRSVVQAPLAESIYGPSLAIADLNSDGLPDLGATSTGVIEPGRVFVFVGDGRGGFYAAPGSPLRLGRYLSQLLSADLNGDGHSDLALLNSIRSGSDDVRVLLNTGGMGNLAARGRLTIVHRRSQLDFGERITVTARLTCAPASHHGRRLTLYRREVTPYRRGPWRRLGDALADERGAARLTVRPRVGAQYRWRSTDDPVPSPILRVSVAHRVEVTSLTRRHVAGRVSPPHPGELVLLRRFRDELWPSRIVARTRLSKASTFRFNLRGQRPDRLYAVRKPIDEHHSPGTTQGFRLRRPGKASVRSDRAP